MPCKGDGQGGAMKIGIISSIVPHVDGGYRMFVNQLVPELERAGHLVETVWLPFSGDPATMLSEMVGIRMMDLDQLFDLVICCRPPAHVVKHRRKVVWFIHHERLFYDLWESEYNLLPKSAYWKSFRAHLMRADTRCLKEAHAVFSNSQVVAERLKAFNAVDAEVLYPPLASDAHFESHAYGSELAFICRIEDHKRQHLAVQAMSCTKTPVRLRIAGLSQSPDYVASLQSSIEKMGLRDRVTIDNRWISEGEKRHLLSGALGVVYIPVDEDSYGYPTLEAASAHRPVVTLRDAGGVSEFVEDGKSGLVGDPNPEALGAAFDRLWLDRKLAAKLGKGARRRMDELSIRWDHVVARLTA